jgi:hypothetical protein
MRGEVASARGELRWGKEYVGGFGRGDDGLGEDRFSWSVSSKSLNDPELLEGECLDYPTIPTYRGLIIRDEYDHTYVPHWYPILAFGTLATISWLPWSKRFGLRTLLIATTLVAVGLWLAVWAARK